MTTKPELRKYYLRKRQSLSDVQYHHYNQLLCKNFFSSIDLSGIRYLHIYLPILKNKEPDTWLIINEIREKHQSISLIIPRVTSEGSIEHYIYDEQSLLEENAWGIQEPSTGKQVRAQDIDLVLVPLLAFDTSGHRLGYGKGYYDKFLALCHEDCQKVGLSFFEPVPKLPEINQYDISLDCCITPSGIFTP